MVWKDAYSVGNERLDAQHRKLIETVNALDGDAGLGGILDSLREYADTHFRDEEHLLAATEYPELDQHRSHHKAFRAWLDRVVTAHRSGGDAAVSRQDVHAYLKVWLANHLLVYDQAYVAHLKWAGLEPILHTHETR
jgi:hemerythrin